MHIILLIAVVLSGLVWGIVNLQRETRRRQWAKKNTTPLYNIGEPRDLVATLAFALLKCAGDLTTEQKESLLNAFRDELKYSEKAAEEAYSYASYVIATDPNFAEKTREIIAPALAKFDASQRSSALELLQGLGNLSNEKQEKFLAAVKSQLALH